MSTRPRVREWSRDGFFISTDPSLIPLSTLNTAFSSSQLYWASSLPEDQLKLAINNSLCFGLYSSTSLPPKSTDPDDNIIAGGTDAAAELLHEVAEHVKPTNPVSAESKAEKEPASPDGAELIGFARLITDFVTFSWLTDVYVLPAWQGQGLAKWLIGCVQETLEDLPHLRRSMAVTGQGERNMVPWYEKMMKMVPVPEGGGKKYSVIEWKGRGNVF